MTVTSKATYSSVLGYLTSSTARTAQVGISVVTIYILYHVSTNDIIFFSGHIVFNALGIFGLAQSIILVQPTSTADDKQIGGTLHGWFNLISISLFLTGFWIVYENKERNNVRHFYSWHGIAGLTTYLMLISTMLVGITQYWFPSVYGSIAAAKSMYKYHRVTGYFAFLLSFITVLLSTWSSYNAKVLHMKPWSLFLAWVVVIAGVGLRVKRSKMAVFR
ncbi:eukaryotic cytochrome b561-domain-containing protein [Lipomyces japonicus]|uniref:eukaryotic cytochrome b561-domain-containing protein n=1 Tax=Lipomyces japonicus TaxID=56871 RepID=UPI0034CFE143